MKVRDLRARKRRCRKDEAVQEADAVEEPLRDDESRVVAIEII